jgi:hypothetical protein
MDTESIIQFLKYHTLAYLEAYFQERLDVLQAALESIQTHAEDPSKLF